MSYEQDRGEEEEDEVPQQVAELAQAVVPSNLRGIRACKRYVFKIKLSPLPLT
jgi:hypothetical protein